MVIIILAICALIAFLLILVYFLIGISKRLHSDYMLKQALRREPFLALTYDDGPSSGMTNRVLDLLKVLGEKATFFVVGKSVEKSPDLLIRIEAEGHAIGWHTNTHLHAYRSMPWSVFSDTRTMPSQLANLNKKIRLFRPPYGKMTLATCIALRKMQLRVISWTHDSGDTWHDIPEVDDVVSRVKKSCGGVVLLHDIFREVKNESHRMEFVLATTERLISLARNNGWPIITCDALQGKQA